MLPRDHEVSPEESCVEEGFLGGYSETKIVGAQRSAVICLTTCIQRPEKIVSDSKQFVSSRR